MNALFVLRPAKLWAFNIGHPCPSLAKGELLLLSQAQPTIEGSFAPNLSACTITSADNPSIVGSASHCNRSSPLHNGAKCDSSSPKFSTNLKSIPHYHQTPTVPLSRKNPQHYQIVNQRHIAARRQRNQSLYPPF